MALDTFDHPRYELIATGEVFDGPDEVSEYYRRTRTAFPDQRNENTVFHHTDDAVIVEFDLLGTHEGELRGIEPTGRTFRCRMCAFFLFAPEATGSVRADLLRLGHDRSAAPWRRPGAGLSRDGRR